MHQKHLRLNVPKGEAKWKDDPMGTVVVHWGRKENLSTELSNMWAQGMTKPIRHVLASGTYAITM